MYIKYKYMHYCVSLHLYFLFSVCQGDGDVALDDDGGNDDDDDVGIVKNKKLQNSNAHLADHYLARGIVHTLIRHNL